MELHPRYVPLIVVLSVALIPKYVQPEDKGDWPLRSVSSYFIVDNTKMQHADLQAALFCIRGFQSK